MKFLNIFVAVGLISTSMFSQEHFSGISTSKRVGVLNATNNPAELANLSSKFEANLFNFSMGIANDKLKFSDSVKGDNLENKIFEGNDAVNLRIDAQIFGPSFAFKYNKWGFGIFSLANVRANVMNLI